MPYAVSKAAITALTKSLARAMEQLAGFGSLGKEGGLSAERNKLEATTGAAWAENIWADMLA